MSEIKLGTNTSFALNRWPLPEEWIGIVVDELGLDCIQFYTDMLDPVLVSRPLMLKSAGEIKALAEAKGMSVCSTASGAIPHQTNFLLHPDPEFRREYMHWYRALIDMTAALGSPAAGVYVGAFSMSDAADPERKKQLLNDYIEIMADLSRYAKEQGLSYLLVEPMSIPREYPCTIEETKDIFQRLEQAMALPVYLNLDVGHLNIISANPDDANPLAWIRELGQYCKVLHIQQTDAKTGSHHWPFTEEYNAKGAINTGEVIKAVKAHGVDMYLIFELFYKPFGDNDDKVLTTLKESVIHWKKALAEV